MRVAAACCLLAVLGAGATANAAVCPGNPDALGTSRVLVVDPTEHRRLGTMQYRETLPLENREVVLTFDDGPLPPYTNRVLEILASECVKATYFLVGRMAREYPELVRRIGAAGHTIGTHSQNHPLTFHRMPLARSEQEIEEGIASVAAALGEANAPAPFFRIPGLLRADQVENYLAARAIMTWSADFPADDWRHIRASEIMRRALMRIEAKGRGVLLLHDIQPATVIALPGLLRELKVRGYRIVHVQSASAERPKTATSRSQWLLRGDAVAAADIWPKLVIDLGALAAEAVLPAPSQDSFSVGQPFGSLAMITSPAQHPRGRFARRHAPPPPHPIWPREEVPPAASMDAVLPAPSPHSFGYADILRPALRPAIAGEQRAAGPPALPGPATAAPANAPRAPEHTGSIGRWPLTTADTPKPALP